MPPETVPEQVKDILTVARNAFNKDNQFVNLTSDTLNTLTNLIDEIRRNLSIDWGILSSQTDYLNAHASTLLKDITYDEYQDYRKQLTDARNALSYKKLTYDDTLKELNKQLRLINKIYRAYIREVKRDASSTRRLLAKHRPHKPIHHKHPPPKKPAPSKPPKTRKPSKPSKPPITITGIIATQPRLLHNRKGDHLCFIQFITNIPTSTWYYRPKFEYFHVGSGPNKSQNWGEKLSWWKIKGTMDKEYQHRFFLQEGRTSNHSCSIFLSVKRHKYSFTILTLKDKLAIWSRFNFTTPDNWPNVDYPKDISGFYTIPITITQHWQTVNGDTVKRAMSQGTLL